MSHPSKLNIFKQAKEAGYRVQLFFLATSDPQINVARVRGRVREGGHNVPEDKIIERYYRSLALLPLAIENADLVDLYDNTNTLQPFAFIETMGLKPRPSRTAFLDL
jgi:predicted ABC-type ATPase